jgi:hypothetical protein
MRKRKLLVESNQSAKKPKKMNSIQINLPDQKEFVLQFEKQEEVVEFIRLISFL